LLGVALAAPCAFAQTLYDRPVLVTDLQMHTARTMAAMDPEGRFLVTGSSDKTVRIWSASDGKLLRTIRMPAGPDDIGTIHTVAISPDGETIAAGVYTQRNNGQPIYLFDRATGNFMKPIWGLSAFAAKLTFSPDGRYLAAGLGRGGGLRVFDRGRDWSEAFSVAKGEEGTLGVSFAADGRLATSSIGGKIRLYDQNFKLIASADARSGRNPSGIAFSPDGLSLAVGYRDLPAVDIFDGHNLASLPGPDLNGLDNGFLEVVTWSADGQTLFASGAYEIAGKRVVLAWDNGGHGARRGLSAPCGQPDNTTTELLSKATGELLVVKYNPCLTLLSRSGEVIWAVDPPIVELRTWQNTLSVSGDGTTIDFGIKKFGKSPLRFDLRTRTLSEDPPKDGRTMPAKHDGIRTDSWWHSTAPTVNGAPIKLGPFERALSLAIHPDGRRFVLGGDSALRALDPEGKQLWRRTVPGAWDVNIVADGRLVVAAHSDGTIRWYRMDDGRELLAFRVLKDKKNWVTWTPEGFYDATPGAFGVLRWHINHGPETAAEAIPIYMIPTLKRPDALPLVLQELETARALGIADLAAARFDVQRVTGAPIAPGARLHVLTIGISDYGDKAKDLRLKFASKDANDVASALLAPQGGEFNKNGGLYADVRFQYLSDDKADRAGIFGALEALKSNMANGLDQDLAVVLFSGHGVTIDNHFYLLPYGVDARTPAGIKASAISATEFHDEVEQVANYGRVLVLLDACHSGAATGDGFKLSSNADLLRSLMSASNVTVLTSSTTNEFSREDEHWGNGAFTKVLLEALGQDADENHDGVISMSELTRYIASHVPILTRNLQHPGLDQRFEGGIFVAGR